MSNEPQRDDPKQVVLEFAAAYTQWETDHVHDDRESIARAHEQKAYIIDAFCTRKRRSYVDDQLSFSSPPVYQDIRAATLAAVEYPSTNRAHVDTVQLSLVAYRFVLLRKADGWRIDGVKRRFGPDDEWKNTLIGS